MNKIIPVVMAFDSRILLGAAITIKSIIDNANENTIYDFRILHSDISEKNQKNLNKLIQETPHKLKFHYINPKRFEGAPRNKGSWTEIVYYRLLIPEILTEYDKAIYTDVDVFVKEDLSEIYNTDIEDYEYAAVPTCKTAIIRQYNPKRFFPENKNELNYASGFILFNNKLMRREKMVDKFFGTIRSFGNRLVFFDMDTLHLTCHKIKELPLKYCVFETIYEYTDFTKASEYKYLTTVYSDEEIRAAKNKPAIIHYAGKMKKPWQRKWNPWYYKEYLQKIPKELRKFTFRDIRKIIFSKI